VIRREALPENPRAAVARSAGPISGASRLRRASATP